LRGRCLLPADVGRREPGAFGRRPGAARRGPHPIEGPCRMTTPARPVAIVTGGRRGIGLGIARALAAEGFDIAITGIAEGDAATDAMRAELSALGARALYLKADLADLSGHAATVAAIEDALGAIAC